MLILDEPTAHLDPEARTALTADCTRRLLRRDDPVGVARPGARPGCAVNYRSSVLGSDDLIEPRHSFATSDGYGVPPGEAPGHPELVQGLSA